MLLLVDKYFVDFLIKTRRTHKEEPCFFPLPGKETKLCVIPRPLASVPAGGALSDFGVLIKVIAPGGLCFPLMSKTGLDL